MQGRAGAFPCPLHAAALAHPERSALRTPSAKIGFAELDGRVSRMAEGMAPGRVVPFGTGPVADWPLPDHAPRVGDPLDALVTILAVLRAEAVALPLNPAFPPDYVKRVLEDVGPFPATQAGVLVLTSGSMGTPKAALLSVDNLVWNARLSNANIPLASGDRWLLSLPLYHVSGLGVLFRCLVAGATTVIPPSAPAWLESPPDVTHVSLVAAQLHRLVQGKQGFEWLGRLKAILLGGSSIPEGLLREAHGAGLPVHTTYGLTEAGSQVTTTPPGADLETLLTSGVPLHPDALSVDPNGEIRVGGPTRFQGYVRNGRLAQPFDEHGRYATGDLGHLDAAGRLMVTGRRDNQFTAGGENIQPEEIERCLCRLEGVRRAVVVGVPHAAHGYTVAAFIDGEPISREAVSTALAAVLPKHKIPRLLFPWPDDLSPQGGKIMRQPFAERARKLADNR